MEVDIKSKVCTLCGIDRDLSHYRSRGGPQKHLLKSRCNFCLNKEHKKWVEDNPEKVKEYRLKDPWTLVKRCKRRNITPKELVDAYEKQNGCCAICLSVIQISNSAIDHNHSTNDFRGILCKKCNRALGLFGDNPTTIKNAFNYLLKMGHYGIS